MNIVKTGFHPTIQGIRLCRRCVPLWALLLFRTYFTTTVRWRNILRSDQRSLPARQGWRILRYHRQNNSGIRSGKVGRNGNHRPCMVSASQEALRQQIEYPCGAVMRSYRGIYSFVDILTGIGYTTAESRIKP